VKKELKYGALAIIGALVAYYLLKLAIYTDQRMKSPFKYFAWSEFDSPDLPGSGKTNMSEAFIRVLDDVRACAGFPFIITSGYRTEAHNAKVGGVANSSHIKGIAVDIAAVTEDQKRTIAECAIRNGITRIGWGRTFIHLDMDSQKTPNIVWGYGNNPPTFNEIAQNLP
jgi:hypothetical protein